MNTAACGVREISPQPDALVQHFGALRIIGDACDRRPAENEVGAERSIDVTHEGLHHAGHVLHAVPAGDLNDERCVLGRRRPRPDAVDTAAIHPFDPSRRVNGTVGDASPPPSSRPT